MNHIIYSTYYNGISEPGAWPPRTGNPASFQPMRVAYLESPPAEIPIDVGQLLFVDEFLIERTSLMRAYHRSVKHPMNPVSNTGR